MPQRRARSWRRSGLEIVVHFLAEFASDTPLANAIALSFRSFHCARKGVLLRLSAPEARSAVLPTLRRGAETGCPARVRSNPARLAVNRSPWGLLRHRYNLLEELTRLEQRQSPIAVTNVKTFSRSTRLLFFLSARSHAHPVPRPHDLAAMSGRAQYSRQAAGRVSYADLSDSEGSSAGESEEEQKVKKRSKRREKGPYRLARRRTDSYTDCLWSRFVQAARASALSEPRSTTRVGMKRATKPTMTSRATTSRARSGL